MDTDPLPALAALLPAADNILNTITVAIAPMSPTAIVALTIAVLCLIASGFISGSEISFFSLTDSQLEELDESPRGPSIRALLAKPQRLLATILIANNLVNVTIVVLTNFALGPVFEGMGAVLSFVLQTVILTFLILLFGEILPKLYANNFPMQWARMAVPALTAVSRLLTPLSSVLVKSGSFINKMVTKRTHDISTTELSQALEITQGATGDDKEMLEGILEFGDTAASEIMTPRVDITWVDYDMSFDSLMEVVLSSGYSRMPVAGENQDDVKGILYARDLLPYIGRELPAGFSWTQLLRPAYFVPESRMIDDLLEDFRRLKIHMAVVVDEYGGTQGVVTLEDVLEEIVGDIDDEYDEPEQTFRRLRDDTFIFEGRTPLTDFFRITGLDADDYKDVTEDCETLAGMLLCIKGDFPKDKEPLVHGRCRFLVLGVEDHRIVDVRVKVMPTDQEADRQ